MTGKIVIARRLEIQVLGKYMGIATFVVAGSLVSASLLVSDSSAHGGMNEASRGTSSFAHALGSLHLASTITLPIDAGTIVTSAEAPNGAVFVARQSTTTPIPTVVWVVDGTTTPSVAEHVAGGASALAADAKNLYVASYKRVIAFNRQTGVQVHAWNLPKFDTANTSDADLVSLSAYKGTVLVMLPRGNNEVVYQLNAGSTAAPTLIVQGSSVVFGPRGSLFFERSDHRLVARSASGTEVVGPKLRDRPTALGGGVQFVDAVAGGLVWVSEPAGQGLDTSFAMFDQSSLKLMASSHQGSVNEEIVNTTSGALVLGFGDSPAKCPQTSKLSNVCVYRISSTARLSEATPVGSAFELLGPEPAVITSNGTSNQLSLDRLGS
jgi:hypothetical protein